MAGIQHELLSGNVPRNVLLENENNYISYPQSGQENDGFVHLLGKGTYSFPTSCSFSYRIAAPYQFLYLYEGELSVSCGEQTYQLDPDCAAFLPADKDITIQIRKGKCRYFQMYLSGLVLSHYEALLQEPLHYPAESNGLFDIFHEISHIQDFAETSAQDTLFVCKTSMWITNILTEMAIYLQNPVRRRESIPPYLEEIHTLFDTKYGENYSLDELENKYSVSKYRICREFSKYYGESPVQYLNHRRIEEAKRLLLTTDETVHEIGSTVGIHNTNHFINLFKRETGATPLAFKQDAPVAISELHYL